MSFYFISPQASFDLAQINDYLFAGNSEAADRFLSNITQKFELLANFPNMGRRRDQLSSSLRSFTVDDYLIFYRLIEDGIEVVRVVSGYRDLDTLFDEQD